MNPENLDPEIPILSESLTDADDNLNPACITELETILAGMGKTHNRLKNDPEWSNSKDHWTTREEIVGAFAQWACRQSPYGVPDGLETVCKYLYTSLESVADWKDCMGIGMVERSLCDINRWLYEILYEQGIKLFDAWNQCKVGKTPEISFSSRFDGPSDPDRDFIDLDALLYNVCITIRNERRANKAFDEAFEAGQKDKE